MVESLSLLLRLAVAMDRRPEAVIDGLQLVIKDRVINLQLLPLNPTDDLSLELWSLESCAAAFRDGCGYNLCCSLTTTRVSEQLRAA